MIKASVLMTVFNAEKYLEHSINSLLKQSYKKFELIIIDDKSNDNSKRIIQNFKNKKIKKYFLPKHIGRTPALNFGLKKCSGKYIAILDADDLSTKDRLLKQINFLEKNINCNLIGSYTSLINKKGKLLKNFIMPKTIEEFNDKMKLKNLLPHSSVMIRKKFFKKIGYFYPKNFKYAQDHALWLKFLKKTDIYILPNYLTKCRVLENNMTNSKKYKLIREIELVKNSLYSIKNFKLSFLNYLFLILLIFKTLIKIVFKSIF